MSDPVPTDLDNTLPFGSPSQFGATTGTNAPLAGWNPQDATITETRQVKTTANEVADVTDAKEYDVTTETTQSFKAASVAAPTFPEYVGSLMDGKLVTKMSIKTSATDFITMELTGHNHAVNPHAIGSSHRVLDFTEVQGILDDAFDNIGGFGAYNFLGATLGNACAVESSDLDVEIQHGDIVAGENGNHFAGHSYQGHITCKQVFRGTPTTAVDTSIWKVVPNKATGKKQTDSSSITVTAEMWVALQVYPSTT